MKSLCKLDHIGIKIELIGKIGNYFMRMLSSLENIIDGSKSITFLSNTRELEPAGQLTKDKSYKFKFKDFEKQFESYSG